ncbi:MAG: hypothetical protein AAGD07_06100 [Planctomycetota bacterium]
MQAFKTNVAEKVIRYLQRYQFPGYYDWFRDHRERLEKFRNVHAGQDCFLMGNGPSLNQTDLAALNPFHLFGLNKIHLLLDRVPLRLSYHVCVNPLVIEQSLEDFRALPCPSFLAYQNCPEQDRRGTAFEFLFSDGAPFCFRETLLEPLSEGWTVTFVALQVAYFMGFQRVFLVGVDHSFQAKGKPNEAQTLEEDDANHFDPRYFKGQTWQLPDLEGSEMAYRLAKFYFERDGRQVLDATVNGKLDVFPKLAFDEAVRLANAR